jgi:long-chain fatty acid transport protein
MKRARNLVRVAVWTAVCAHLVAPITAAASGFALNEQNASGLGNAYAGSAAVANDASAMFFNAASLSQLQHPEGTVSVDGIDLSAKFSDGGSRLPPAGLGLLPAGATGADAGTFQVVPSLFVAVPIQSRFAFGLGINAPFGLKTSYPDPWIGRFQGIDSELWTVNINPAGSFKVNDWLALGIGVNYQKANVKLTQAVMLGPALEGRARLDVSNWAWGWNIGALATPAKGTRIGLAYRAKVTHDLTGTTSVTTTGGTPIPPAGGPTSAHIAFPDSVIASLAQQLATNWELLGDVSWTHWGQIQDVQVLNSTTGAPREVLSFGFKDTWRVALGVNYHWSDELTFRGGLAWDQSPVSDATRTVRLPDADRKWLALGAQWRPVLNFSLDAGYAHLFVSSANINLTVPQFGAPPAFASTVVGSYDNSVNIYGLQFTYRFR